METTVEWCSHCDTEVELKTEIVRQKCPSCGEEILPCSVCTVNYDCNNCPDDK